MLTRVRCGSDGSEKTAGSRQPVSQLPSASLGHCAALSLGIGHRVRGQTTENSWQLAAGSR